MKILLTGRGKLAEAYAKVNSDVEIRSFRFMSNKDIEASVRDASVIIHNAALVDGKNFETNLDLTKKIAAIVSQVNPKVRFINIGSMSYLGEKGYLPINKMTHYAKSKLLSEIYCIMVLKNVVSVRFSTIYYKDDVSDILSRLVCSAYFDSKITLFNEGKEKRDYIPINIAAKYLDYVVSHDTPNKVNICSGVETSFKEAGVILSSLFDAEIIWEKAELLTVMSKFTRTLPEIHFSLEEEILKHTRYENTMDWD